mmetsp:Transcript_2343/g.4837  ORF Transcript_2343/g.4837 Transcript_2343/m.4837 type:complete len:206 (-) Transcript_2343:891-1508(-)
MRNSFMDWVCCPSFSSSESALCFSSRRLLISLHSHESAFGLVACTVLGRLARNSTSSSGSIQHLSTADLLPRLFGTILASSSDMSSSSLSESVKVGSFAVIFFGFLDSSIAFLRNSPAPLQHGQETNLMALLQSAFARTSSLVFITHPSCFCQRPSSLISVWQTASASSIAFSSFFTTTAGFCGLIFGFLLTLDEVSWILVFTTT